MSKPLRVLMVEDSESDISLLRRVLEKGGYHVTSEAVETPAAMRVALNIKKNWDIIISDHSMPRFNAPEALAIAKELCPEVPFIILSGEIDLNLAVSLMRNGAQDFIQKKELSRILPAVERELEKVELKKKNKLTRLALSTSEDRFKEVLENSLVASYKRNLRSDLYDYFSPVITRINGYTPEEMNEFSLEKVISLFHPDDLAQTSRLISKSLSGKKRSEIVLEYRFKHKKGHYVWLEDKYSVIRDTDGTPTALIGSVSDITNRKNLEEEVRAEKSNLEKAQQIAHIGSWNWDMLLNKVEWSKEMYRIFDIDPETLANNPTSLLKIIHPEDVEIFKVSMDQNLANGSSTSLDYRVVHKNGSIHVIHAEGKVEFNQSGVPIRSVGTVQDITERKQAEEALRESEEKYKRLHETAGVGIGYYSPDGVVISYNNLAAQHMGGTPEDFRGKPIYELFPKSAADVYMARIQKAIISDHKQEYEDLVNLTGDQKWFLSTYTRILNSSGEILGIQIISSDISKRKRDEEALLESEELFRTMFESSMTGICLVGLDGTFLKVNDTICNMLEYSRDELVGKNFKDVTLSEDIDISTNIRNNLLSGKNQSCTFEKRYVKKDGTSFWANLSISVILNSENEAEYFVTYIHDINERKISEQRLHESEEKFVKVFQAAPAWVAISDFKTGVFLEANDEAFRVTGFSREQIVGHTASEIGLYKKEDRQILIDEINKNGRIFNLEMVFRAKDGSLLNGLVNGDLITINKQKCLLTIAVDITARKKAEEQLNLLKYSIDKSFDCAYWMDTDGNFIYVNEAASKKLGYSREELLMKHVSEINPRASKERWNQVVEELRKQKNITIESIHRRKDGSEFPVELSSGYFKFGEMEYINGFAKDINERKKIEERIRNLNVELEQKVVDRTAQFELANKELESFSYSISHDLQAPVRRMNGFAMALKEDYFEKLDEKAKKYIKYILEESQRLGQLIDALLRLSHVTKTTFEKKKVDLSSLATSIVAKWQDENPDSNVETIIQPGLIVDGYPDLLEVMLINLIENAIKYSSKVKKPVIQFGQETVNGTPSFFIRDNGIGFNMDLAQNLFGAFQRLHSSSEFDGTGIGLATVKRIVNKHNGRIWADAKLNQGATFYFTLGQ